MLKKNLLKITIFFILLTSLFNFSYGMDPITVPETDLNLRIVNLTRGCEVYFLLSTDILKYNMEKFISNNTDNPYELEDEEAQDLKEFLDKEDYIGYLNYFKEIGFNVEDNEIELRHYSFCFGKSEIMDYVELDGKKYVQIRVYLDYNNQFKLILKDYLKDYDPRDSKFMIDEYGVKTYINLNDYELTKNELHSNITECNVIYTFYTNEDFEAIERNIKIAYWIINIIIVLIIIVIITAYIKYRKTKKQEIEDRKFWKKKLTKEELKEQKKKEKEEKKKNKKSKKK